MAIGAKRNETRGCRTFHRGDIAIHVAKTDYGTPESLVPYIVDAYRTRKLQPDPNSFGHIIAVVDIYDVQPTDRLHNDAKFRASIDFNAVEYMFGEYERPLLLPHPQPAPAHHTHRHARLPVHRLDCPGGRGGEGS